MHAISAAMKRRLPLLMPAVYNACGMRTRVFAAALLAASAAVAQTSIIQGDSLDCFHNVYGATAARVDVDGPGFTRAWRITSQMSANPWDVRIRCYDVQPVRANDVILATFWMRTISSTHGYGLATFVVEENVAPDYFKPATLTAVAAAEWKRFQVPFVMPKDYATAPTNIPYNLSFWVTFDPQTIEIGGISVENYGPGKTLTELGFTYEGREPDAPWRKAAAERIEKYRKSDIIVVVKDDQGRPVKGAAVKVNMKRHAFGFGTAVSGGTLRENARYAEEILKNFNKVVIENDLKWPFWESWGRDNADYALNWLAANGISMVRGHNVIWPDKNNLPGDVVDMLTAEPVDEEALRNRISDHISQIMAFTKGRVTEWDVLNEPYTSHDVQDVLGNEEMAAWFQKARQIDPDVGLYINDFSILSSGGWDLQHQNAYYDTIQYILDHSGPIDGIGLQSHFNVNVTPPARVLEILDRFAAFGKDLQVTEFDVDIADEQIQADYTRDFLTAAFSHPAVKGFLMWGFWAGAHWLPRGAMFTLDWQERENYRVWRDLVYNQWWTNAEGLTGDDGIFRARGFLGDYDVEINGAATQLKVEAGKPNFVLSGKQVAGTITAVTNAAGYTAGRVAPGEIVVIWGDGIGPAALTYPLYDDGWQRFAGDIRVLFDGAPAPLIYASRGQIAAIVPYSVSGSTRVAVEYQGTVTNTLEVPVADAVPGIFTANMQGYGLVSGGALMPDNSWATLGGAVKARKDSWVALYITGEGRVTPAAADGKAPGEPYPSPALPVEVRFGDKPSPEVWAGLVYAGVTQVNAKIPKDAPSGDVPVTITVGGIDAQPRVVTVPVE